MTAAIRLEGVRHRFGEVEVLHGIDLTVVAGRMVALVGPSGSGKTTVLAVAGGLLRPTAGRVHLDGADLYPGGKVDHEVARRAAFVLQASSTIPFLTVAEHLSLARRLSDSSGRADGPAAADVLDAVDLAGKTDRYPEALSGGERQRLCLARALVAGTPVLLGDEPTASLDRARGRAGMELLADHAHDRGAAVLIATHDERALDLVDRVVTIEDGRVSQ